MDRRNNILYRAIVFMGEKVICCLTCFSPKLVSKIRYRRAFGKKLDLKEPKEFNEKLMWLKLNDYSKNPLVIQCADKVRVREYVEQCGCGEILTECLGVYESTEEIPWKALPQQFVLKCNHGAGYNIVCDDKNKLDVRKEREKLKKWLKQDYSLLYAEMQYHYIKPLIICEKYLQPASGFLPDDYKVYCFHGKAKCVMVCRERESEQCKYYMMDRDWNFLDWIPSASREEAKGIERPLCLKELLSYAERLSKGFPFVRMDFYVLDNRIYFGEMTFTPCGCVDNDYTETGNLELSKMLKIE